MEEGDLLSAIHGTNISGRHLAPVTFQPSNTSFPKFTLLLRKKS